VHPKTHFDLTSGLPPPVLDTNRLSLTTVPASRYLIRRAWQTHQLSTLETNCAALALLEGEGVAMRSWPEAFNGFVDQQLARRPLSSHV